MSDDKRPYGADAQIYTFGIHGTENRPSNVTNITNLIRGQLDQTTKGPCLADSTFDWTNNSGLGNGTKMRTDSAVDLRIHVVSKIKEAINDGSLDPNKALTVNLAGFSHGGNVALLASDDIARALKRDPQTANMQIAMHVTTLSTPAYTSGAESPDTAKSQMPNGVRFDHTHFSVNGDSVIRGASGNSNYWSNTTHNAKELPAVAWQGDIANHGAPQDHAGTMVSISNTLKERFQELSRVYKHSDVGNNTVLASAMPETQKSNDIYKNDSSPHADKHNLLPAANAALSPTLIDRNAKVVDLVSPPINTYGAQSPDFKNNPTVQQVSAALERNGIAADQNPSLVAGLAGAAANLSKVQDVALTPQTAFALDRDKFDPAANRASVSMDVVNKPFDEVWQKASVALQQTQAPAVAAQAQVQDVEQKSARAM
ncbi:MAG: hypothetical protein V4673_01030 [Pseudomonadota bacterium]